jgi:hypothetical protein
MVKTMRLASVLSATALALSPQAASAYYDVDYSGPKTVDLITAQNLIDTVKTLHADPLGALAAMGLNVQHKRQRSLQAAADGTACTAADSSSSVEMCIVPLICKAAPPLMQFLDCLADKKVKGEK